MARQLSDDELKQFAKLGAQARLEQIEVERRAILRAFPGLAAAKPAAAEAGEARAKAQAPSKKTRKRRKMTAAEKKASSERMKKIWAARKQQG
jgi:hypothetical protein